jgi:hypothetical protein
VKLPRISVNSILAAVAVIAIDCMVVRSVRSRPRPQIGDLDLIILTSLPMANLLVVGITLLLQWRGRCGPFLPGFVAGGWTALIAYIGLTTLKPDSIDGFLISVFDFLGEQTGCDMTSPAWATFEEVGAPALLGLPLVLVALAGGYLSQKFKRRSGGAPVAGPPHQRLGLGSLLVLLALIGVPALVIEGALRGAVDPKIARLAVGSEAVLSIEESTGWMVELPDKATFLVPNGSKVRVDDDGGPSIAEFANNPIPPRGLWPVFDGRTVRVTLLEGERAGTKTWLYRCYLNPLR